MVYGDAVEASTLKYCSGVLPTRMSNVLHGPSLPSLFIWRLEYCARGPAYIVRPLTYKCWLGGISRGLAAKDPAKRPAKAHIIIGECILGVSGAQTYTKF
jgi:hypothetical protein